MDNFEQFFSALEKQFFLMPTWKWILIILVLILFPFIKKTLELLLKQLKQKIESINNNKFYLKYILALPIEKPISWILALAFTSFIFDVVQPPEAAGKYAFLFIKIVLAIKFISLLYYGTNAFGEILKEEIFKQQDDEGHNQIIPFITKILKVLIIILGILITLQNLGFNVLSLLAGLGLGGLALALAAQETVANLFGSVTILFDKPFKVGDHIKIMEVEGIVQEIGFRSTVIKTFYNSKVTIPNATVAKEKIDNLGIRDKRRTRQILNLSYETSTALVSDYCLTLEKMLSEIRDIETDSISVKLVNLAATCIEVQMFFHINTQDSKTEMDIQQKAYSLALDLAKNKNIQFVYPSQKVYLIKET